MVVRVGLAPTLFLVWQIYSLLRSLLSHLTLKFFGGPARIRTGVSGFAVRRIRHVCHLDLVVKGGLEPPAFSMSRRRANLLRHSTIFLSMVGADGAAPPLWASKARVLLSYTKPQKWHLCTVSRRGLDIESVPLCF